MSQKILSYRSWLEDEKKLITYRLNNMVIGDALRTPDNQWVVLYEVVNGKPYYVVYQEDSATFKRRRPDTLIDYLLDQESLSVKDLEHYKHDADSVDTVVFNVTVDEIVGIPGRRLYAEDNADISNRSSSYYKYEDYENLNFKYFVNNQPGFLEALMVFFQGRWVRKG